MVRATETQRDRLRQADRDRASGRDSTGHSPHRNRAPPRSAPGPVPPTCPCPTAADSAPRSGRPGTTPTARTDLLAARSPGSVATEYYARDQIGEAHRSHETRCASNPGCFSIRKPRRLSTHPPRLPPTQRRRRPLIRIRQLRTALLPIRRDYRRRNWFDPVSPLRYSLSRRVTPRRRPPPSHQITSST
jgi:hypothetical protein